MSSVPLSDHSNKELRLRAENCAEDMKAIDHGSSAERSSATDTDRFSELGRYIERSVEIDRQWSERWMNTLHPEALAILDELDRRMGGIRPGEPYYRMDAVIKTGKQWGAGALTEAGDGLARLASHLPESD